MSLIITFLRHGRSRADDEGVHEGRYDSPLTSIGESQAFARAREFRDRGINFDVIVSSPLQRSRSTAQIFAKVLGEIPIQFDEDWMEIDNGLLAGMKREVAAVKYPKPGFRNPYEPVGNTGESAWEAYCRATKAVEKIVRQGAGRYLVVAHGGILNEAMKAIMGLPPRGEKSDVVFRFGDLGYARVEYHADRHIWVLLDFSGEIFSA